MVRNAARWNFEFEHFHPHLWGNLVGETWPLSASWIKVCGRGCFFYLQVFVFSVFGQDPKAWTCLELLWGATWMMTRTGLCGPSTNDKWLRREWNKNRAACWAIPNLQTHTAGVFGVHDAASLDESLQIWADSQDWLHERTWEIVKLPDHDAT